MIVYGSDGYKRVVKIHQLSQFEEEQQERWQEKIEEGKVNTARKLKSLSIYTSTIAQTIYRLYVEEME